MSVRTPPRRPYDELGTCSLCGTETAGRRRTWCSGRCVDVWLAATGKLSTHGIAAMLDDYDGPNQSPHLAWEYIDLPTRPQPWPDHRLKGYGYRCVECNTWHYHTEIQVDHVRPLWSLTAEERTDLKWWGPQNLQILCTPCHAAKTRKEAAERARSRREARTGQAALL